MTWEMDQKIMQKRYYQQGEKSGEMKKSLEIAKTLLKDGMPVEKIARITNLPVEEVYRLHDSSVTPAECGRFLFTLPAQIPAGPFPGAVRLFSICPACGSGRGSPSRPGHPGHTACPRLHISAMSGFHLW